MGFNSGFKGLNLDYFQDDDDDDDDKDNQVSVKHRNVCG